MSEIVDFCPTHFVELTDNNFCPLCQKEVAPATIDDFKKTVLETTQYLLGEIVRVDDLLQEVNTRLESES